MNQCAKNIKVIFAHGNGGSSPQDHWFPYVKTELEKLGVTVVARQFPDSFRARESHWIPFLKKELKADQATIIIGHSSGAVAAMRLAETNKILGSVLVAVCHTDLDDEHERQSGYFDRAWDWDAIKRNQQWTIVFASLDDPFIPIEEPRFIRDKLKPEYHEFRNQGHFGGDCNKLTFPELVAAIKRKLLAIID